MYSGTTNLDNSEKVCELVSYCAEKDRYLLSICAAPSVLGHMGLLEGKKATCYPGFEDELKGAVYTAQSAVQDGKIITGKGPGATVDFASLIISALKSEALASDLRSAMQCHE